MSNNSSTEALLQASGLNRFYGDYHAVNDFNLTLNKGQVLGLLGPNGAGKSSAMKMLTGNISPSSGHVLINGISLIEEPELAKRYIGYLPEQPPVYKDMTVNEFLMYCTALHSLPKNKRGTAVAEASERCGLESVQNKLIANLSKGFQQRVGIAQAILHSPSIVILDEPTVGLDPLQIKQIRQLIRELGDDHAVILSTHILPEVQAVCDRVQIIRQGETVFSDSFAALANQQEANELVVSFTSAVDVESLQQLSGINKVEPLDAENSFRLLYTSATNNTDVFQLAVDKGWQIRELVPQQQTLEQIFMDLVHSDVSSNTDSNVVEALANE